MADRWDIKNARMVALLRSCNRVLHQRERMEWFSRWYLFAAFAYVLGGFPLLKDAYQVVFNDRCYKYLFVDSGAAAAAESLTKDDAGCTLFRRLHENNRVWFAFYLRVGLVWWVNTTFAFHWLIILCHGLEQLSYDVLTSLYVSAALLSLVAENLWSNCLVEARTVRDNQTCVVICFASGVMIATIMLYQFSLGAALRSPNDDRVPED